ncbi:MAG: hypothetical protein HRU11_06790 [Parvularculaceae bacterium]|nr:hypothetical protein [Parvularculaceae bacterium]
MLRSLSFVAVLSSLALLSPASAEEPPLAAFHGTWLLENDRFEQVWDGKTVEVLTIPNHVTECEPLNTVGSVLCQVSAGDFTGHILWTTNGPDESVRHQSHFGTSRLGVGQGELDDDGNLRLTIQFSDEPEGTYRFYEYVWNGHNRYTMLSTQYGQDGEPTGNYYKGSWVRAGMQ